jgi:hypothetical protein
MVYDEREWKRRRLSEKHLAAIMETGYVFVLGDCVAENGPHALWP